MIHHFRYPFDTKTIRLKGTGTISYIDEGTGQPILFIHGLANYALGWKKNIEDLKHHFRCIAIDLPGNGLSESGNFPYSIQYFASVINEFIEVLELEKTVLAGHSMGGQIAITALLQNPGAASRLILCAPAGFEIFSPLEAALYKTSLSMFSFFSSDENSLKKSVYSSFYKNIHQADGMIQDLISLMHRHPAHEYSEMVKACISGMMDEPVFNSLHLIRQPVQIIFGENDALIPARALHPISTSRLAELGAAEFQNASLHILPRCGHFVQWEKSEKVNELIRNFLKTGSYHSDL